MEGGMRGMQAVGGRPKTSTSKNDGDPCYAGAIRGITRLPSVPYRQLGHQGHLVGGLLSGLVGGFIGHRARRSR
jgi:hypothetical protein